MNWIQRNKIALIGALIGGILGYGYYFFIGCKNGSCSIVSKPFNSTAYGGLMGFLVLSTLQDVFKNKNEKK